MPILGFWSALLSFFHELVLLPFLASLDAVRLRLLAAGLNLTRNSWLIILALHPHVVLHEALVDHLGSVDHGLLLLLVLSVADHVARAGVDQVVDSSDYGHAVDSVTGTSFCLLNHLDFSMLVALVVKQEHLFLLHLNLRVQGRLLHLDFLELLLLLRLRVAELDAVSLLGLFLQGQVCEEIVIVVDHARVFLLLLIGAAAHLGLHIILREDLTLRIHRAEQAQQELFARRAAHDQLFSV